MTSPEIPHSEISEPVPHPHERHETILHPETQEPLDKETIFDNSGKAEKIIVRDSNGIIVNYTDVQGLSQIEYDKIVTQGLIDLDKPKPDSGVGPLHL